VHQNVLKLNVSVHDAPRVYQLHSLAYLLEYEPKHIFRSSHIILDPLIEVASFHALHDDQDLLCVLKHVDHSHNARVILVSKQFHQIQLSHNLFSFHHMQFTFLNGFDSDNLKRFFLECLEYFSEASRTKFNILVQDLIEIFKLCELA
jgi:hypothetical protein